MGFEKEQCQICEKETIERFETKQNKMQENEVSEDTALFSGVDLDFYKTYELVEDPKALIYKVSTFKSIGWPDPFPDDVTEFDDDSEELSQ